MNFLLWKASKARLREDGNVPAQVSRREIIRRGLVAAAGLVIAKTMSASADEAPAKMTPRAQRAPVDRTKLAAWRTCVRIIEK